MQNGTRVLFCGGAHEKGTLNKQQFLKDGIRTVVDKHNMKLTFNCLTKSLNCQTTNGWILSLHFLVQSMENTIIRTYAM